MSFPACELLCAPLASLWREARASGRHTASLSAVKDRETWQVLIFFSFLKLNERSLRPTEMPRPEPDAVGAVQKGRGTPGEGQSHRQEMEEGRCLQIRVQYRQKQKRGTQGCVNTGQRNPREKTGGRFRNLPAPTFKASIKGTR